MNLTFVFAESTLFLGVKPGGKRTLMAGQRIYFNAINGGGLECASMVSHYCSSGTSEKIGFCREEKKQWEWRRSVTTAGKTAANLPAQLCPFSFSRGPGFTRVLLYIFLPATDLTVAKVLNYPLNYYSDINKLASFKLWAS